MDNVYWFLALVVITFTASVSIVAVFQFYEIRKLKTQLKTGHDKSLRTQRAVIKGQLAEQMFPLLQSITSNCTLSDFKFFGGNPIDYIWFKGLTKAKDNGDQFEEVVFVDIKTGDAKLSDHQKKIKEACNAGRVRYATFRLLNDGTFVEES